MRQTKMHAGFYSLIRYRRALRHTGLTADNSSALIRDVFKDVLWMRILTCSLSSVGLENLVPWNWPLCNPPSPLIPPYTNTTISHWHGWYEENCAFCSNMGHMQRIKYSSSQNLLLVNELLIWASSSHISTFSTPSMLQFGWRTLFLTLTHTITYITRCVTLLQLSSIYLFCFVLSIFSLNTVIQHMRSSVSRSWNTHKMPLKINDSCDHWSVPAVWAVNNLVIRARILGA